MDKIKLLKISTYCALLFNISTENDNFAETTYSVKFITADKTFTSNQPFHFFKSNIEQDLVVENVIKEIKLTLNEVVIGSVSHFTDEKRSCGHMFVDKYTDVGAAVVGFACPDICKVLIRLTIRCCRIDKFLSSVKRWPIIKKYYDQ
ncbi:hypothetical protein T08_16511 [Trichinella sp. T8]|nr:hypothetical protein T08_16511 [Trichinella sp. T8]